MQTSLPFLLRQALLRGVVLSASPYSFHHKIARAKEQASMLIYFKVNSWSAFSGCLGGLPNKTAAS